MGHDAHCGQDPTPTRRYGPSHDGMQPGGGRKPGAVGPLQFSRVRLLPDAAPEPSGPRRIAGLTDSLRDEIKAGEAHR